MSQAVMATPAADVQAAVVEWAPFRLKAGVTEQDLLVASEGLQEDFLARQPGFVRRELLRAGDGWWVDLVYWADAESALGVLAAAAASPVCHRYFALMEGAEHADPGAGVTHLVVKRRY